MDREKFRIIRDPVYGYLRADPIPTKEEVDRYYREEFYSSLKIFNDSALEVQTEERFFDSRWESICEDAWTISASSKDSRSSMSGSDSPRH
jgi:hypothetical protein